MIRIAAAGDLHYGRNSAGRLARHLDGLQASADILLLAGDLTQIGTEDEARALATDLRSSPIPVCAVLGNHDFHSDQNESVVRILGEAGVRVLEDDAGIFEIKGQSLGVVGMKGFGGGFLGACGTDFGEPEMKAFVRVTKRQAESLKTRLLELETDYKIALLHYSPCADTLAGEKREIYPFLGSYLLAEAIDHGGADLVLHGHAHHGVEKGQTPGGVPVRNVAQPVIRHAFNIYSLNKDGVHLQIGRGAGDHHGARPEPPKAGVTSPASRPLNA